MATSDWLPETADWQEWSVPAFPPALATGVQTVGTMTSAVATLLDLARTTLEAFSAIQLERLDLTQAAVSAASAAIDAALAALETDTGIYLLLAPPRRKVIVPAVVQTALTAVGLPGVPAGRKDLRYLELETAILAQGLDPAAKKLLAEAASASGGSASLLRTVLESLIDTGDASRPQLATTDAVAGFALVSGAPDYGSLLSFLLAMDSMVGPGRPASALNAPDLPTPQDLKVVRRAQGAQLSWKNQPLLALVPAFDLRLTIPEIAVIRSSDPKLLLAKSPADIFGTTALREGQTAGSAKVIKLINNATGLTTYLDETIELSTEPAYYTLAFHLKDLDNNDLGFGPASNVVKLIFGTSRAGSRSSNSAPPDWIRSPRAIDLIPELARVFDWIRTAVASFKGASLGTGGSLKAYTEFLQQLSEQYGSYVTTANDAVTQLSALAATSFKAGAGVYSFSGVGGMPYLTKTLTTAFSQLKFSSSHFVGGAVIVVAGPSPAVVEPVYAILQLLLGTGTREESVYTQALAGLNDALTALQVETLGDDFTAGSSSSSLTQESLGDNCAPTPPTVPTLKDDFTV